jgi:holo-[acyl-carrier protein] synthase
MQYVFLDNCQTSINMLPSGNQYRGSEMNMYAVGLDVVATERISRILERFGERFVNRLLGPEERELFDKRVDRVALLAGRFAAKEAAIKAFGRFLSVRPQFVSIQILPDSGGQPHLHLAEDIKQKLAGHSCLVSISHEKTVTAAVVIIVEEK